MISFIKEPPGFVMPYIPENLTLIATRGTGKDVNKWSYRVLQDDKPKTQIITGKLLDEDDNKRDSVLKKQLNQFCGMDDEQIGEFIVYIFVEFMKSDPATIAGLRHIEHEKQPDTVDNTEEFTQETIEAATEIMKHGKPFEYIIAKYNKLHVGDEINGKLILTGVGCQSLLDTNGLQPTINGASGKGKSHSATMFCHLLPTEFLMAVSLSAKALYYQTEAGNLKPSTVVLVDDLEPGDALESTLKRSMTNFQQGTEHLTVIDHQPKTVFIPPRIMYLFTSVIASGGEELKNRQFGCVVDETPETDSAVCEHTIERRQHGIQSMPIDEEVMICRCMLKMVKEQLFTVQFKFGMNWKYPQNRRNLNIFIDIMAGHAAINYLQREQPGSGVLIANRDDFETAKEIFGKRGKSQLSKLGDNETKLLNFLGDPGRDSATLIEIQEYLKVPYQTAHRLLHGRSDTTSGGLLDTMPGLTFERIQDKEMSVPDEYNHKDIDKSVQRNYYSLTGWDIIQNNDISFVEFIDNGVVS